MYLQSMKIKQSTFAEIGTPQSKIKTFIEYWRLCNRPLSDFLEYDSSSLVLRSGPRAKRGSEVTRKI